MLVFAPRLTPALVAEIERLARRPLPIAEINRLVGRAAWRRRLSKPSYERVRVIVHAARRRSGLVRRPAPLLDLRLGLRASVMFAVGRASTHDPARSRPARASPPR